KNSAQVMAVFKEHSYFDHPKHANYRVLLLLWCVILAFVVVAGKRWMKHSTAIAWYAAALTLLGLFMMLANCFLNVFQPRYTLPMWELTIISISVLFGETMTGCCSRSLHRKQIGSAQ